MRDYLCNGDIIFNRLYNFHHPLRQQRYFMKNIPKGFKNLQVKASAVINFDVIYISLEVS